jgi:pseudaminic acid cytidylyltransferase
MIIAILPARKNSKRIKGKNIKNFFNKPLITWTIKKILDLRLFSDIYVSTDSRKIAEIALKSGAKILFPRPKKLSNDKAKIIDVMSYEIKKLIKKKEKFNSVFCIFPTGIFAQKKHYYQAVKRLNKSTDYIFTAIKNEKVNIKNFYFKNDKLSLLNPQFVNTMTQQIPQTYKDAGQFYFALKKTWLTKKNIFSKNSKVILIDKKKTVDIDNLNDFKQAKKIFKI